MALRKIKLGELIELSTKTNDNLEYGLSDVKGISIRKAFIDTKADMQGVSLKPYLLVKPDFFAYVTVTSRNGNKISIAHNSTDKTYIVSSSYIVFKTKNTKLIDSNYLYMLFNRPEFDRYSRYDSWGSAREIFSWNSMCDIEIELPDLATQEKFVKVYLSMLENQKSYECGLDDLKLVCNAYIEDLKKKIGVEEIGQYLELKRNKNSDDKIKDVYGVSNSLQFITASSSVDKENITGYKIVNFQDMAYVPTTHMKIWAAAISDKKEPFVVSPIYEVFGVNNKDKLLPEYLFMWLCREETIRYVYYNSWGSARENFVFDDFKTIKMPIPSLDIQQDIVNIYTVYKQRKQINEQLKEQIKNICPILVKGSIEEAKED